MFQLLTSWNQPLQSSRTEFPSSVISDTKNLLPRVYLCETYFLLIYFFRVTVISIIYCSQNIDHIYNNVSGVFMHCFNFPPRRPHWPQICFTPKSSVISFLPIISLCFKRGIKNKNVIICGRMLCLFLLSVTKCMVCHLLLH